MTRRKRGERGCLGLIVLSSRTTKNQLLPVCRTSSNLWATMSWPLSMTVSVPSRCAAAHFQMRCMDGLAAARQIAEDPGTPVIILTAHGHPNLIDQAVEDGVVSYLLKPITNPALNAAIEVAVARAREIQALQENVDHLKMTLRERKLIERAKGILMSRRHLNENEAFRLLQRQSQDRRIPMAKLAESIIQTDELLEAPNHTP